MSNIDKITENNQLNKLEHEELNTNGFHWYPIDAPSKSDSNIYKDEHYSSGDEDGIQWYLDLDCKNTEWIVTVTDGENTYTENFTYLYEPIFGIDLADADRVDEILDRLISKCKNK